MKAPVLTLLFSLAAGGAQAAGNFPLPSNTNLVGSVNVAPGASSMRPSRWRRSLRTAGAPASGPVSRISCASAVDAESAATAPAAAATRARTLDDLVEKSREMNVPIF